MKIAEVTCNILHVDHSANFKIWDYATFLSIYVTSIRDKRGKFEDYYSLQKCSCIKYECFVYDLGYYLRKCYQMIVTFSNSLLKTQGFIISKAKC